MTNDIDHSPQDAKPEPDEQRKQLYEGVRPLKGCCKRPCTKHDKQLSVFDYLAAVPGNAESTDLVEVQFKNSRKQLFYNSNHLALHKGDLVVVEANPGHDLGAVTLTGRLAAMQLKRQSIKQGDEIRRIYRVARTTDIELHESVKQREESTMIRARQIAKDLQLGMKIGDVEYQADGKKAIFYYIADARVDFRKLIKLLADEFQVRVEMRQIGARQEAGRIGGIGPCGRELCCATWLTNFVGVSTASVRLQEISPNPQKLAGQCAKLKCCMNYEVESYVEASRELPDRRIPLETADGTYYIFKTDILSRTLMYSTDRRMAANLVTLTAAQAHEIIAKNKAGEQPELPHTPHSTPRGKIVDLAEQDSLTRFDDQRKKKKKKKRDNREPRENRENREPRDKREPRDNREKREPRENRENREPRRDRRRSKPKGTDLRQPEAGG